MLLATEPEEVAWAKRRQILIQTSLPSLAMKYRIFKTDAFK